MSSVRPEYSRDSTSTPEVVDGGELGSKESLGGVPQLSRREVGTSAIRWGTVYVLTGGGSRWKVSVYCYTTDEPSEGYSVSGKELTGSDCREVS